MKAENNPDNFVSANKAYSEGKYEEAIKLYEEILKENQESSSLYYNMGNAYFKSNNIARAILNYERAKKLNPDDEDINANLKLAVQKTEDKIEVTPTMFLEQWKTGITDLMSEKQWSVLVILLIITGLLIFSLYVLSDRNVFKQIGFFGGSSLLILALFTFFIAKTKYNDTINSNIGIITSSSVTVKSSPLDKGTRLFLLHEGTKVKITKKNEEWTEIQIANGNIGWIKTTELEKI